MAWKHLQGRTTELHSAQSLRREPVVTRAALCHASSRARPVRFKGPCGLGTVIKDTWGRGLFSFSSGLSICARGI
jgi:hypothetical protein